MNRINQDFNRALEIVMRPAPSEKVAKSLVTNLASRVLELLDKGEKLTKEELHDLTRLRMLSRNIKI